MASNRDDIENEDDDAGGPGLSLDLDLSPKKTKVTKESKDSAKKASDEPSSSIESEDQDKEISKKSSDSSAPKKIIEDLSSLSPEERIKRRKEERERLEAELKVKMAEREKLKAKQEEEEKQRKLKEEEDRKKKILEEEEEKKRQALLEQQKKIDELKRKKEEEEAKKRKREEDFFANMGLTPDGKPLEKNNSDSEDDVFKNQLEKAGQEHQRKEEEATRRMVLDDLEFSAEIDDDDNDEEDHPEQVVEVEQSVAPDEDGPPEVHEEFRPFRPGPADQSTVGDGLSSTAVVDFPSLEKCSFCKIHKRKLKAQMIYENDLLMIFLDPRPIHQGQLLITPRGHYPNLAECPEEVAQALISAARLATAKLKESNLQSPAVSFYLSESIDVDISERHLYLSAIPRRPNDGVTIRFGQKDVVSKEQMVGIAKQLRDLFHD